MRVSLPVIHGTVVIVVLFVRLHVVHLERYRFDKDRDGILSVFSKANYLKLSVICLAFALKSNYSYWRFFWLLVIEKLLWNLFYSRCTDKIQIDRSSTKYINRILLSYVLRWRHDVFVEGNFILKRGNHPHATHEMRRASSNIISKSCCTAHYIFLVYVFKKNSRLR